MKTTYWIVGGAIVLLAIYLYKRKQRLDAEKIAKEKSAQELLAKPKVDNALSGTNEVNKELLERLEMLERGIKPPIDKTILEASNPSVATFAAPFAISNPIPLSIAGTEVRPQMQMPATK